MGITSTPPPGLPPQLFDYATDGGRRAGLARKACDPYERCRWSLSDPSITRRRLAAAWFQAFGDASGLTQAFADEAAGLPPMLSRCDDPDADPRI